MYQQPLTQKQAETRHTFFNNPNQTTKYTLFLKIKQGDTFEGHVTIQFDLQKVEEGLFLDFAGSAIHTYKINGVDVVTSDSYQSLRNDRFLTLPKENLLAGKNEVSIKYTSEYVNDGNGLHKFVDIDNKVYYYTTMCPFNCNKVFPCFDQPDIKAAFDLTVAHQKDHIVIANDNIDLDKSKSFNVSTLLTTEEAKDYTITVFNTSPVISTYLFAVIAGPFSRFDNTTFKSKIPMSVYCRESLSHFLKRDVEELFEFVIHGCDFYEEFFGYPYSFGKFDMIFCPEFVFGAMENPGAVTFNDASLIFRDEVVSARRTRRLVTVVHELSHMWFGNLVTMKWWNDIWLNESFANYIAYLCMDRIASKLTKFKPDDAWCEFFINKERGYSEDQLRTTHPVAGSLDNTDQALTIFDGITYQKGSACLKQLLHLIGFENFSKGIQNHFKRFAWGNANLNDFIESIEDHYKLAFENCPQSLRAWKDQFLTTTGVNECEPELTYSDSGYALKLKQTAALKDHPTLRNHKLKAAFFNENAKVYHVEDVVLKNEAETVVKLGISVAPKGILLNYEDEAFLKVRFDQASLEFFQGNVSKIEDQLSKLIVWRALWDMCRDGLLSSYHLVKSIASHLHVEKSEVVVTEMLNYAQDVLNNYTPKALVEVLKPLMFDATLKLLLSIDLKKTNTVILLKGYVINFAYQGKDADNYERLLKWIKKEDKELEKYTLSLENEFAIGYKLMSYSKLAKEEREHLLQDIIKHDSTNAKINFEKKCRAVLSTKEELKALWDKFLDPEAKESNQTMGQIMTGYCAAPELDRVAYVENFYDNVVKVFNTRQRTFALNFFSSLLPGGDNVQDQISRLKKLLETQDLNEVLKKKAGIALDSAERKARTFECSKPVAKVELGIDL